MEAKDKYKEILRRHWGYNDFRGIQHEIITNIGAGFDTLGLMPTGGGKSITFQVPALAQKGVCIVVTPLIALMKDQVQHLRLRGIKATAVYSGMTHQQILTALENCILGDYKFLYVSPERLETELFQTKLRHMNVSFITVDEAHCISQWGYDFRPSYLQIAKIRKLIPNAPILALTASATQEVVNDIMQQLQFREGGKAIRMSFERKNLTYIVRNVADKWQELLNILNSIQGSTIIYTRNRQQTHELAKQLNETGISATNYHAGLAQVLKDERQEKWHKNEFRVMVATNAFGMGIDKPDVRLVIHMELPDSPEAYFQEAGRAGRDGLQAWAVLLYNPSDGRKLMRRIDETYPEPDYIKDVYEHMCFFLEMAMGDGLNVVREFDLQKFCYHFKYFPVNAHNALLLLSNAGYIEYMEEDEVVSRLMFSVTRNELYNAPGLTKKHDDVLKAVMRTYAGVFAEQVYIDEYILARNSGLTVNEVYLTLKEIAHMRYIQYIPRKRITRIRFCQRRVEKEDIILRPEVYATRRKHYEERINAMLNYVTNRDVCHSRFLLEYFGEPNATECGRCDVCKDFSEPSHEAAADIRTYIRRQLAIKGELFVSEIDTTGYPKEQFATILGDMMREEEIIMQPDHRIKLA